MRCKSLVCCLGGLWLAGSVAAQAPTPPPAASGTQTSGRPDAVYPKPSGQDSAPKKAPVKPQQPPRSSPAASTVESRGTRAADQTAPVQKLAKQKTYSGNSGKKPDPGTACSTARPTPKGGVDCGMNGSSAVPGGQHPR
jgi:hypothetical protein